MESLLRTWNKERVSKHSQVIMTLRSILISYVGIALVGVGFSFSLITPSANAKHIYNDNFPTIGIDSSVYKYKLLDYVMTSGN